MSSPDLLVPIRADALWLSRPRRVIGPLTDLERLPWFDGQRDRNGAVPHLAAAVQAPPFTDHQAWLEAGVHLCWALPDGLTRGSTRRSGERTVRVGDLWLPPAPNRWLVLRREPTENPDRVTRAWLVQSDYVHPPGTRPATAVALPRPAPERGQAPYVHVGRQIELDPVTMVARAVPPGTAVPRIDPADALALQAPALTALGGGDPLFAAHYPSCRSVFGLHDDDPPQGRPLRYAVYGWYGEGVVEPLVTLVAALRADPPRARNLLVRAARERGDPLAPDAFATLTDADWHEAARLATAERFGWHVAPDDVKAAFPGGLVCLGQTELTAGTESRTVQPPVGGAAGLGNSPAEALVAFLCDGDDRLAPQQEAALLHALEDDDLTDHAADLDAKLAEARHAAGFRPQRGHAVWTLRPADGDRSGAPTDLPEELAHELARLNDAQRRYDRAQDAVAALRQDIFGDWSRYMTAAYPEGDADPFSADVDAVQNLVVRDGLGPLEALRQRCGTLFHGRGEDGGVTVTDRHAVAHPAPEPAGPLVSVRPGDPFSDAVPAGERLLGIDFFHDDRTGFGLRLVAQKTTFLRRGDGPRTVPVRLAPGEHVTAVFGEAWRGSIARAGVETDRGRRIGPFGFGVPPQRDRTSFRLEAPAGTVVAGLRGELRTGSLTALGLLVARPGHFAEAPPADAGTLAAAVVGQHAVVRRVLSEAPPPARSMTLGTVPGPRFWRPNDPVIALADPAGQASPRHGQDGAARSDGLLACTLAALPGRWAPGGDAFAGEPRAPLGIAPGPWTLAPHALPTTSSDGENWHALQLEWEVELQPLANARGGTATLAADAVTGGHLLREVDLGPADPSTPPRLARAWQYLSGRSLLNPSIGRLMRDRLDGVPQVIRDRLVQPLPASVTLVPLGGFHDHLLMQGQAPQLDVADPVGLPQQRAFTARVRDAVGALHPTTPLPDSPFHPLRTGELLVERLRVMDTFGRSRTWRPQRVLTPRALRPRVHADRAAGLPVRLAQAARLDLRWLSAAYGDAESSSHPAASPVCGWLLPNVFDGEIAVYARSGLLLGSVGEGGTWWPAPGDTAAPRDGRQIAEPALRRVVAWLTLPADPSAPVDRTGALLDVLGEALQGIDPKDATQQAPRALLVGRPLAIVRARLALELREPAARDQSVRAMNARIAGDADQTQGLGRVEVPVRLGAHGQYDDGLCGYWVEDGGAFRDDAFVTTHGVTGDPGHLHIRVPPRWDDGKRAAADPRRVDPIHLTPDGEPVVVTMLIDPRGAVHATCGLLPVKSIAVPPDLYVPQVSQLRATFRTRPVLTDPVDVALPLPGEPGAAWSWIDRDGDRWREVPHHPTVRKAAFLAAFGAVGPALWQRLQALGRLRIADRDDLGLLLPGAVPSGTSGPGGAPPAAGQAPAAANPYADLSLDVATVERGLHDLAESIGDVGTGARFGARPVIRDGWLQLRAEPVSRPNPPEVSS